MRISYPKMNPLLASSMRRALFKLELKSSLTFQRSYVVMGQKVKSYVVFTKLVKKAGTYSPLPLEVNL